MTVPPLTERLEAAINAVYTADEGTSSYRLDDDTRALLREAKAALEEQFLVRWQLDDIRRQMEEARAEGDWPLAKVIGRAETAEAALEAANARARMLERRADATQADNDALVALADAARELIDGHGDEQLALNVLADALDAYDRDALAGTDGGEQ